jgi:hypothetical protein
LYCIDTLKDSIGTGGYVTYSVRLDEFAGMTPAEQAGTLTGLVRAARTREGTSSAAAARVRAFELRYEMSTAEMIRGYRSGELRETADIAEWLFWAEAQDSRVSA